MDAYNATIPIKQFKCKEVKRKPWLTAGLLTSIRNKNKIYKRLKCDNYYSSAYESYYKKYRNKLNYLICISEKLYFKNLLESNKNNLRNTWKILNQIINRNKTTMKKKVIFKHNGVDINNEQDIANKFNNYFVNIGKELTNTMQPTDVSHTKYLRGTYNNTLYLYPATSEEVYNILLNLKNSSAGHDDIDSRLLKQVSSYIIQPLTHICNLSLSNGIFPQELKLAKVLPIFKSGDPTKFNNYRPISILPSISKIFEKIIYTRIVNYLERENVLYKYQFGFRKNHSTQMALSILIDQLHNSINCKKYVLGVFLDLSKAFDLVNYNILFSKLEHYGIRGHGLKLIKDYLNEREQYVQYNTKKSPHGHINMGVPQGSILGPLLFLIYINDLPNVCDVLFHILFADDTNIFISGNSISSMCAIMNKALSDLNIWFKSNKLLLNINKTNCMIFAPCRKKYDKHDVNLHIDGVNVLQVTETKFLGVLIDDALNWKAHIDFVKGKLMKTVGILYRARNRLDTIALRTLYTALILPYLSYCITVWGHTHKTYIDKLHVMQKRIIRVITFSERLAHTKPLYDKLKIMNIDNIYTYFTCMFVYKYYNQKLPNIFHDFFTISSSIHSHNTRNSDNLRSHLCVNKITTFHVKHQGPILWNKLPTNIKNTKSIAMFKSYLRKFLISV